MTGSPQDDERPQVEGPGPDDEPLIEKLRGVATEVDPVPERMLAAARGTYTWRTVDAELAVLAYDSVLDDDRAALVRGSGEARLLTFAAAELTIELEVTLSGERRRIVGQLVPRDGGRRRGESRRRRGRDHRRSTRAFRSRSDRAGPVSLRCRREEAGTAVATEWVTM